MRVSTGMPRFLFSVPLFFICSILWSDGGFISGDSDTFSADQRVIFIKDKDTHFMVCTTGYTGEGEDFFWIIPTPWTPDEEDIREPGESAEELFALLEKTTVPLFFLRNSHISMYGFPSDKENHRSPDEGTVPLRSDYYGLTVLSNNIAPAEWFKREGISLDEQTEKKLDEYIRKGWSLVVAEIMPAEQRHYENEFLPPLMIKIPNDEIILPLRISAISSIGEGISTVFILGDSTFSVENSIKPLYWNRFINPERFRDHINNRVSKIREKNETPCILTYKNTISLDDIGTGAIQNGIPLPDSVMNHLYLSRYDMFHTESGFPGEIQFIPDELLAEFSISGRKLTDFSQLQQNEQEMLFFFISVVLFLTCPVLIILGLKKILMRLKRSKESLSRQYDELYDSFLRNLTNSEGIAEFSPHREDTLSISLIIRLPVKLREKIAIFQEKMQEIDADHYYYPPSDLHLSVLTLIPPRQSYEPRYLSASHLPENYDEIINRSLKGLTSFTIQFNGVSAGPRYLYIKGFPEDNSLRILRDNLKRKFKKTRLKYQIDRKLRIGTAKIIFLRIQRNLADPEKVLSLMDMYENFEFGSLEVDTIELVQHDSFYKKKNCRVLARYKLGSTTPSQAPE